MDALLKDTSRQEDDVSTQIRPARTTDSARAFNRVRTSPGEIGVTDSRLEHRPDVSEREAVTRPGAR